jgi:hypothetical protein
MTIGPNPTKRRSRSLAQDLAPPDRQELRLHARKAEAGVAWVVERERMILGECRPQERSKLLLVLRRGDDEVRDLALRRQREHPLVARAVLADEAGPVDREKDRLVVLADVVDRLVERPLEEGRVERHDRPHAAHRDAGRQRDRVLLGDPDVEEPVGELRLELREPRSRSACRP